MRIDNFPLSLNIDTDFDSDPSLTVKKSPSVLKLNETVQICVRTRVARVEGAVPSASTHVSQLSCSFSIRVLSPLRARIMLWEFWSVHID